MQHYAMVGVTVFVKPLVGKPLFGQNSASQTRNNKVILWLIVFVVPHSRDSIFYMKTLVEI